MYSLINIISLVILYKITHNDWATETKEEHDKILKKVIERRRKNNIKFNQRKMSKNN